MRIILFNLLPYRQIRLQRQKKVFWTQATAVLLVAVAFCYLITDDLASRVNRKSDLLAQIENVEQQIANQASRSQALRSERDDLIRRIEILESVDAKSARHSQLFSLFDSSRPEQVSLVSLGFEQEQLSLKGLTTSLSQLSQWVNDLKEQSALFRQINIIEVRSVLMSAVSGSSTQSSSGEPGLDDGKLHEFELKLDLVPLLTPPAKEPENEQS